MSYSIAALNGVATMARNEEFFPAYMERHETSQLIAGYSRRSRRKTVRKLNKVRTSLLFTDVIYSGEVESIGFWMSIQNADHLLGKQP